MCSGLSLHHAKHVSSVPKWSCKRGYWRKRLALILVLHAIVSVGERVMCCAVSTKKREKKIGIQTPGRLPLKAIGVNRNALYNKKRDELRTLPPQPYWLFLSAKLNKADLFIKVTLQIYFSFLCFSLCGSAGGFPCTRVCSCLCLLV